jgi:hypothetical protein
MNKKFADVTCVIKCRTHEESDRVAQLAKDRVNLERAMPNVIRYYPHGTEVAIMRWYRLSDYFEEIKVQPEPSSDSPAFRLFFQPRADGDPYWKDVMVSILQDIRSAGEQVSITIERSSNSEPAEHVGTTLA